MGIGRQIAIELVRRGYDLCLLTHNLKPARELQEEVLSEGHRCHYYQCRVENEAEIATTFQKILQQWGHIDLVFTNMGMMPDNPNFPDKKVGDLSANDWQHVFMPAVMGIVNSARWAVKGFQQNNHGGKIINCAFYGLQPTIKKAIYTASRRAVEAINETINHEYPDIQAAMLVATGNPLAHEQEILNQLDDLLDQNN